MVRGYGWYRAGSNDGVLLVEEVPDDVVVVAEAALQHHPAALVAPNTHKPAC